MMRGAVLMFWCVTGCAATQDVYLGTDVKPTQGGAAGALTQPELDAEVAQVDSGVAPNTAGTAGSLDAGHPSCSGMTADCDRNPNNGCETDLGTDSQHCGRCGNACQFPDCSCRDGQIITSCPPGRANCDGDPRNGCEIDSNTSMQNCGACGSVCATSNFEAQAVCTAGRCHLVCEPEFFPRADCDGNLDNGCETFLGNDQNCSACGERCTCNGGACQ
jgi:hypothetical protein